MTSLTTKRPFEGRNIAHRLQLIGYLLTARPITKNDIAVEMLQRKCIYGGFTLKEYEIDIGLENNPIRPGLWNAFRHLICSQCDLKPMPNALLGIEDWLTLAFAPCNCSSPKGLDGIVVGSLHRFCNDPALGTIIMLKLAQSKKHFIAEDGVCLSCCHSGTKAILEKNQERFK
jgi:hypothetical protein